MWRPRTAIFHLLGDLCDLLREQNSLLRESIEITTHRPARTPHARTATPLPAIPRPPTPAQITDVIPHRGWEPPPPPQQWEPDPSNPTTHARLSGPNGPMPTASPTDDSRPA